LKLSAVAWNGANGLGITELLLSQSSLNIRTFNPNVEQQGTELLAQNRHREATASHG